MSNSPAAVVALLQNIGKVIRGKDEQIKKLLCCWFAGGHVLIEDVPGTGKTILARAMSRSAQVDFKRVQFTPDLLPSDILGSSVFNQKKGAFEFMHGPIFTTIFLADEINRATPRTQAALLECMAEGQVTAEGTTAVLNPLFFVMATQNPVEQHGTFPLPEAQLDRFMMKLSMGYPSISEEIEILKGQNDAHPISRLAPVVSEEHIGQIRALIPRVSVSDPVYQYAASLVAATRRSKELRLGASPRATLALVRAAKALALVEGYGYVSPSHVQGLARSVLAHRLILTPEARLAGRSPNDVLDELIKATPVPVSPS